MRIVVTGGRYFDEEYVVHAVLNQLRAHNNIKRVATGGCPIGVDKITRLWAKQNNLEYVEYKAEWKVYGRAAGPIRNRAMLMSEKPDLLVAFPGRAGTRNCISWAKKMDIQTMIVSLKGWREDEPSKAESV